MKVILRFSLVVTLGFLQQTLPAVSAPQQLYGKTIVVSWQEDRVQKNDMDSQARPVSVAGGMQIYVSDQGRPFSRLTMGGYNKRGQFRSGGSDAVDGAGARAGGQSFARNVSFGGRSMSVMQPRGAGGAMRLVVSFDPSFQTCSAQVTVGKGSDSGTIRTSSLATGAKVVISSAKASGESCSIQAGNVFAR
jgi:hypothetical protein